ncbi:MAG: N-acetylmuramoyl-L-alanine amidase [Anaeroplasmataceae bacterium]
MRKIYILFYIISLSLCFFITDDVNSLDAKYIYIDPGHGGVDGGSVVGEVIEKDINLSISFLLKDIFESNGYQILLTRDGDYDLSSDDNNRKRSDLNKRVELINNSNSLLYLSIHMNKYSDSKYSGAQVFYNNKNSINRLIAKNIQNSIKDILNNTTRREKALEGIYLLDNTIIPGVLVECGFLSNDIERNNLLNNDYQKLLAKAIYLGCRDYLIKYD